MVHTVMFLRCLGGGIPQKFQYHPPHLLFAAYATDFIMSSDCDPVEITLPKTYKSMNDSWKEEI